MNSSPSKDVLADEARTLIGVEGVVEDSDEDPNKATRTSAAARVRAKTAQLGDAARKRLPENIFRIMSQLLVFVLLLGYAKEQLSLEEDPSPETKPEVAWLMSYPNSGTSYTRRLVHDASEVFFIQKRAAKRS